jgi:hypothetical protein
MNGAGDIAIRPVRSIFEADVRTRARNRAEAPYVSASMGLAALSSDSSFLVAALRFVHFLRSGAFTDTRRARVELSPSVLDPMGTGEPR